MPSLMPVEISAMVAMVVLREMPRGVSAIRRSLDKAGYYILLWLNLSDWWTSIPSRRGVLQL
jgi:hypothetical protein